MNAPTRLAHAGESHSHPFRGASRAGGHTPGRGHEWRHGDGRKWQRGVGLCEADLASGGGGRVSQLRATPSWAPVVFGFAEAATPTPDQQLTEGIPAGHLFTPLAGGTAHELPLLPAKLTLSRQTFEPGAEVPPRTATGPILFIVERGTLTTSSVVRTLDMVQARSRWCSSVNAIRS